MAILLAPRARSSTPGLEDFVASPKVMLVDRQPLFVEALGSLLEMPPLAAVAEIASRSDLAVAAACSGEIDLVVCDVLAEPMDGKAVVRSLQHVSRPVPVILLGDLPEITAVLPLLREGLSGLFTKDVAPDELLAGVEAVLAGHQALGTNLLEVLLAAGVSVSGPLVTAAGQLSPAEREVLALVGLAHSVPEIAAARGISEKTVRNHMASIYRKLDVKNRTEAMLFAARLGLIGDAQQDAQIVWARRPRVAGTLSPRRHPFPIQPVSPKADHR